MDEYIKRDLLIQLFNDAYDRLRERIDWAAENEMWSIRYGYKACRTQLEEDIGIVKSVDAADVRPVVRGRWIFDRGDLATCSNCGSEILKRDVRNHKFCHYCGADMRGKEAGTDES